MIHLSSHIIKLLMLIFLKEKEPDPIIGPGAYDLPDPWNSSKQTTCGIHK